MKLKITLLIFSLFSVYFSIGQTENKVYFDKRGISCTPEQAYYYRSLDKTPNSYKSFYISTGGTYFEGKIKNANSQKDDSNTFIGTCIWYYKNGNKKAEKSYSDLGIENGTSYYYYENGKILKEIEYKNGIIVNNKYKEFGEDGQVSLIMEDDFINNINDWDLYESDKSYSIIKGGSFELKSYTQEGTSRYISNPIESKDYTIESIINFESTKGMKSGLIWGFKDWQNFNYFLVSNQSYYLGTVYEGINGIKADGIYTTDLNLKGDNILKLLCMGDETIISINGVIQSKNTTLHNYGSNIGFSVSGKSGIVVKKLLVKEIGFKNSSTTSNNDMSIKSTGSGLMITESGYILTNYHVVEGNNKVIVDYNVDGVIKSYEAKVIQKDIDNDIAIIKIQDESFKSIPIKFTLSESGALNVGASVFTLGYPYALSGMGKDAKFTDGKISAKTGFDGAINSFQTSIPVQPGNSGGPVFNEKGQLIGVINAKISGGDNVSYAIKLNYVKNLIDLLPEEFKSPSTTLESNSLEDKIKSISSHVVLIKIK